MGQLLLQAAPSLLHRYICPVLLQTARMMLGQAFLALSTLS